MDLHAPHPPGQRSPLRQVSEKLVNAYHVARPRVTEAPLIEPVPNTALSPLQQQVVRERAVRHGLTQLAQERARDGAPTRLNGCAQAAVARDLAQDGALPG